MLELTKFWSYDHIYNKMKTFCWWRHSQESLKPLLQNIFILRRPGEADFAGIIKIVTMSPCLLKKSLKTQKKVKRIRNYVPVSPLPPLPPSVHPWAVPKTPILNRAKRY